MNVFLSVWRTGITAVLIMAGVYAHSAFATCTESGGDGGALTIQMPSLITVDADTPVGTVVFEGTQESSEVTIKCNSSGTETRKKGYTILTDSDSRSDVMEGVYQTNVPGIGIRVAASNSSTPEYTSKDIVIPYHFVSYMSGTTSMTHVYRASAQLVVTGTPEEGDLDTSRLISEEKVGGALIGRITFAPTSVHITTVSHTCNLVDNSIYVPLKTVNPGDFDGQYSDILTDGNFKIELTECSAGTQIDYQFKSSGSTGVMDGNILTISNGDSAASGVGLQILDKNDSVLSFDKDYTAISSTSANEAVDIPLQARYVKTGDVKAGKVDAVATFEVFYR